MSSPLYLFHLQIKIDKSLYNPGAVNEIIETQLLSAKIEKLISDYRYDYQYTESINQYVYLGVVYSYVDRQTLQKWFEGRTIMGESYIITLPNS
jgi:hypothetical protein